MFLKFLRDRCGSVLPTFAIAAVPLIVATGAVVDYSRAFDQKTVVQDAMDAAALASGKMIGIKTDAQIKAEAQAFFVTNVGTKVDTMPTMVPVVSAATITLTTTLTVPTYFLGMIGINEFSFSLKSMTTQAMGTLEVAMALDNSGSMSGTKISTLKTAATDLVTTLYNLAGTSTKPNPIEVGIIPFSAAVNIGPAFQADGTATWLDKTAVGTYHGDSMDGTGTTVNNFTLLAGLKDSSGNAITWGGCVEERPQPYDVTDDGGTTATPATMFVPMVAPDEPDNLTATSSCSATQKIGVSGTTLRYNCAPAGAPSYNNYLPDVASPKLCGPAVTMTKASPGVMTTVAVHNLVVGDEVVFNTTGALYTGLTSGTTYYVKTVTSTTKFTVSATSGGTAINTSGTQSGTHTMTSSAMWTCANGTAGCNGGAGKGVAQTAAFAGVCKYGTAALPVTPSAITVGGLLGGPNFMCTSQAITPLTPTKATVTTAINNMLASGATNIMAGVAWGWRVLSDSAPFTQGRSYSTADNKKILIVMTDGENTYYPNSSFLKSWYASFGYAYKDHLQIGTTAPTSAQLTAAENTRTLAACTNVKAADIHVYTIGFEINSTSSSDPATALALLKSCASDADSYFDAQNEAALTAAFTAIGDQISLLRISQ